MVGIGIDAVILTAFGSQEVQDLRHIIGNRGLEGKLFMGEGVLELQA